ITADLTRNSKGTDTTAQGHIPDGIPINFTANRGIITSPLYTKNGKANSKFSRGSIPSGVVTITATLDNQSVQTIITLIAETTKPVVTTNLVGGIYNTTKSVTLTASDNLDLNPVIYYSLNNGSTWNSKVKTVTLNLNQGITNLKFYARNAANNTCTNQTITYTIDITKPTVTANPLGGTYSTIKTVTLTATDNLDPQPAIYYTTNGTNPTTSSTRYTKPINIVKTATLKFMAVDFVGNQAQVQSQTYILKLISNINTNKTYSTIQEAINDLSTLNNHIIEIKSGTYFENVLVTKKLIIKPAIGANVIVQALNPLQPVFKMNRYGNGTIIQGLNIRGSTNSSGVHSTEASNCIIRGNNFTGNYIGTYLLNNTKSILTDNIFTNNTFSFVFLNSNYNSVMNNTAIGNYHGARLGNSNYNLIQGNTIKNNPSGYGIGFEKSNYNTIRDNVLSGNLNAIYIGLGGNLVGNCSNNLILNNNMTGNNNSVYIYNSTSNTIYGNNLTGNYRGVCISSSDDVVIYNNFIANGRYGIYLGRCNNTIITENSIINTVYGINPQYSSATIHFNRITSSSNFSLVVQYNSTVNATNNWWGSNNPLVSLSNPSDICIQNGTVVYNPWIVLNLTGSFIHVTKNSTSRSQITADVTHNNQGQDTSSSGTIPDGLPVNFNTTLGTITPTTTTKRGKANVTLTSSTSSGPTTVTATLDNQKISKVFHKSFSTIQSAINDPLTLNGYTIVVGNGTYIENVIINKTLTLISEGDVTVQALNSSNPVFTINSGGNGSLILGFNIKGAVDSYGIYLNSTGNCTVWNNTITGNEDGVFLQNSSMNTIAANNINNSKYQYRIGTGIYLSESFKNRIIQNNIIDNDQGIWVLDSGDNEISENTITGNLDDAITVYYQYAGTFPPSNINDNVIMRNNISCNNGNGIQISDNRYVPGSKVCKIYENNISNNLYGIFVNYGSVDVYGNDISYNEWEGIWISGNLDVPPSYIHFNRISQNQHDGLFCNGALVNATNNWWGTNTPVYTAGTYNQFLNSTADIFQPANSAGIVLYNPFIILTTTPTSYKVSEGKVYESTITAKLIFNSYYEDTSSRGYVPDGVPVNFTADHGTITNISYTTNGKASSRLILDPNFQSGLTNVTATVDNESDYLLVDRIANANIRIMSSAINVNTNLPLDVNYTLPLNESTIWISVLWKNTGLFHNKVDLIVNGNIVSSWNVVNSAYLANQNNYPVQVFNQTLYLNGVFLNPLESNIYLQNFIKLNPQYQNYTKDQLLEVFLARIKQQYSFTDNEINFIRNNRNNFTDSLFVLMTYPGDAAEYLTLENSNTTETLSFIKPGDVILRESPMIYFDGYTEDGDAGYEGVRSFAIATTKITNNVVQYWLDRQSLYAPGAMKAAYGTFLTSLLVIKCHDMVADQAATAYNVTWTRTTPVVVSCLDDAKNAYITGESSLRMGMDVNSTADNVWAFRFACSSAFSPIEYYVAGDSTGLSVTLGLGERILNGELPELFMSNGYLVYKIQGKDDLFLLLDPVTGIVTDCALGISGVYCYHDQITNTQIQLAQNLTSNDPNVQPAFPVIIGSTVIDLAVGLSEILEPVLESVIAVGGTISFEAVITVLGPISLVATPIVLLEVLRPDIIEEAEMEGNFNTAQWWKQNIVDRWKDALQYIIFRSGGWSDVLDEQNAYINRINQPLYEQRDQGWQEFYNSIHEIGLYDIDDYFNDVDKSNMTDEKKQEAKNIGLDFWLKYVVSGGGDDDNTKYIPLGTALATGVKLLSDGISKGDVYQMVAGGTLVLSALTVAGASLTDGVSEALKMVIEATTTDNNSTSGGGGGGAF
ncbi:right-handed parallel beta-helix repeat-containing protein, partial [Methanobacterium subterraneum]